MSEHLKTSPGWERDVGTPEGTPWSDASAGYEAVGPDGAEIPGAGEQPRAFGIEEETEESRGNGESVRRWIRRVVLDACLLGMGMLLIALVVGVCSAGGLVLLAGGAMEVMVFAGAVGGLIGVTVAMVVQVVFMGGMARPVRLCSLLLVVWGLTLSPLCCVGVSSVLDPQYSGELNRFVFTRSETTASIVGVLMVLELLAWLVLVVREVRRYMKEERR